MADRASYERSRDRQPAATRERYAERPDELWQTDIPEDLEGNPLQRRELDHYGDRRAGAVSGFGEEPHRSGQTSSGMLLGQEAGESDEIDLAAERQAILAQSEPVQSFRGRGPKGYVQSDARLREIICERLLEDPYIDASDVVVEVANGEVALSGSVGERWVKYQIEELVERSTGTREIHNRLRVQR